MRGFAAFTAAVLAAFVGLGRLLDRHGARVVELASRERPCDGGCGRVVHPARAHTHHHEPGCGERSPWRCSCTFYLCAECCPCDIAGLVGRAV